ncbi:MAG: tol-pal system protein YbgF [Hyphomicrobiaceae bacterium]
MPGTLAKLKSTTAALTALAFAAALATLSASVAFAQATPPPAPAPKPAKAAAPAAPKAAKPEAAPAGDAALRQRIEHLEEQLVDMQVIVGTLDSFAKSTGAASASPAYRGGAPEASAGSSSVDQARVSGLESQVRALTAQVQQLTEQVRAQGGQQGSQRRSDAQPVYAPAAAVPPAYSQPAAAAPTGFSTSVQAAAPDSIDSVIAANTPVTAAASPPESGNPKQLYETAYGYLLQQDYGASEAAFDDFLKRFPNDGRAGDAQFWLGETYFVRGQFKPAASAFLKGYQTYGKSAKAPDSLLKLAMSLGRMGQKDAACSSFGELNTRFPAASADVKARTAVEKQRAGC